MQAVLYRVERLYGSQKIARNQPSACNKNNNVTHNNKLIERSSKAQNLRWDWRTVYKETCIHLYVRIASKIQSLLAWINGDCWHWTVYPEPSKIQGDHSPDIMKFPDDSRHSWPLLTKINVQNISLYF